jgi:pimeloyl-ACP methyl ester carboxylesterase
MRKENRFHTGEVELNYAKGPDNGPPLVLLHGLTARWQEFLKTTPHLIQRHTVYAVDHRGHGKSGRVPGRYRGIDYGEDVRSFIEGVIGKPAIVHGFSLGGIAAVYLAAHYPALVSALILEEPPLWDNTPVQWLDYFGKCQELASLGKTAAELCEILQAQNTWDRTRALWLSQLDPGTVAAAIDKSIYEGYETEAMLKRISCPVLLIYGDPAKGSVLTQEQVDVIRTSIPDCVADFVDAGHLPRSDQPMKTMMILINFLESL